MLSRGATMKKIFLIAISVLLLLPGMIRAEDFSLYGVSMGMTREDVDSRWQKLEEGKYFIENSILLNINLEFDHEDKLFKLIFSLPVPLLDKYPASFVNTSFQDLVQKRWAAPTTAISVRVGRGVADITVLDKTRQDKFMKHISDQMKLQLSVLLKP
jgi:hypothetical protein